MIAKQSAAMKGFPLKQVMTTTTTAANGKSQTNTTTLTIINIEKTKVADDQFEVPAGYKQVDSPLAGMQALQRR
jgi:predicted aspartyl protease